jgi:beta-carotene ketolase (CrtW type)
MALPAIGHALAAFAALEFCTTSLFITAHDAMHGSVAPGRPWLNHAVGALCLTLYAGFDYEDVYAKHMEHHGRCGVPSLDPDFFDGEDARFVPWFLRFMTTYASIGQAIKLQAAALLLMWAGAPLANLAGFWLGAGLLSAVRLFVFGTYLPHRPGADDPPGAHRPWTLTRSSNAPRWLSFLRCFHLDFHFEHHLWPEAPWWDLPRTLACPSHRSGDK